MAPNIDFLRPRRAPLIGWWLLAMGAIMLAASAWGYEQRELQLQARESLMLQREAAARQAREVALRPRLLSVDEQRLQHVGPQLNQPWLQTLRVVEGATEAPVYLLGFSADPSIGKVQLDAEAPSFDHALAYVQVLSDDATLSSVQLASHDAAIDPTGAPVVRFTVLAHWRQP